MSRALSGRSWHYGGQRAWTGLKRGVRIDRAKDASAQEKMSLISKSSQGT
jgi:hypothetical protein